MKVPLYFQYRSSKFIFIPAAIWNIKFVYTEKCKFMEILSCNNYTLTSRMDFRSDCYKINVTLPYQTVFALHQASLADITLLINVNFCLVNKIILFYFQNTNNKLK